MDTPYASSWTGAHENFQAKEYDAGASLDHQASQRVEQKEQLDNASTNFEDTLILLCQTLMCGFNEAHFVYCNGP